MYHFLAFLCGAILAVMIQWNGGLSAQVGVYHAALYIHIVGAVFAALVLVVKRKPFALAGRVPLWMYLGGAIGVLTTLFNNLAFSHISLTSIVALGLFAQLVFSWLIDSFGWFGMERRGQKDLSILGTLLSVAGIALMLENPTSDGWGFVLISLGAGITVVLSRIVNAHLSQRIGTLQGALVNHLVGLPFCLLLALAITEASASQPFISGSFRLWIWCGGILGVVTVAMCNVIVPKLPAYQLSLFMFCGQLFCGMMLDVFGGGMLNKREFGAGILVAAGIAVSQVAKICRDRKHCTGI